MQTNISEYYTKSSNIAQYCQILINMNRWKKAKDQGLSWGVGEDRVNMGGVELVSVWDGVEVKVLSNIRLLGSRKLPKLRSKGNGG